jgi:hypothetical protein
LALARLCGILIQLPIAVEPPKRKLARIFCMSHEPIEPAMKESQLIFEEVTDPIEVARSRVLHERARRNSDWLQAHWPDLLPQARGKFVAVAGQEAFVADTAEEAWAWAAKAHPEDDGALCQYVFPHTGPRIYGHRWRVADVR